MGRKLLVGLSLSVIILLATACIAQKSQSESPMALTTTEPVPSITPVLHTTTPKPTATEDNLVTISINNDTGDMICAIFAYTSEQSGELPNLIEGKVLLDGESLDVDLEKGEYDFQVWDCQMNTLQNLYQYGVEEDFTWDLSGVPEDYTYELQQSVIFVNERAWDVCELYIRPADSEDWGENLFAPAYDYYLAAGSTLIEPIDSGIFDFKLVYCDGTVASVKEDLEIPEGQNMTWTLTP